jgi:hypothetical protein
MMQAIIYHLETGEILRTVNTRQPALQCGPGEGWLEGEADADAHYVAAGCLLAKRALTLSVTDHGISGLPHGQGAVVLIDGQQYPVDSGYISFAFTQPGPYRARVVSPGYCSVTVELAGQQSAGDGSVPHAASYVARRVEEYPDVRDQLDAIMKGGADLEAMRQRVLAVKAKYPK